VAVLARDDDHVEGVLGDADDVAHRAVRALGAAVLLGERAARDLAERRAVVLVAVPDDCHYAGSRCSRG